MAAAHGEIADTKKRKIRFKRGRPEVAVPPEAVGEEAGAWDPFSDYRKAPDREGPASDDPQATPAKEPATTREDVASAAKTKAAKPIDASNPSAALKDAPTEAAAQEVERPMSPAEAAKRAAEEAKRKRRGRGPKKSA